MKEEGESKDLNAKQLLFCNYYVSEETFGNGVQSYCKAYNIDYNDVKQQAQARHCASRLLQDVYICRHINTLIDSAGLNDQFVDKQLLFVITQNADLGAKIAAMREYNKLKQRITDKLDVKVSGTFDISLKLE